MTDVRLFLTYMLLFLAWIICPKGKRYHIKVAADFIDEDSITDLCGAAARRKAAEKKTS